LEVNVSGEPAKHGVSPQEAGAAAEAVAALPHLALEGLMTVGPLDAGDAATARAFASLKRLRDGLVPRLGLALPRLSMGMSDDFVLAIEAGATEVRLGRALFGPPPSGPRGD
jgi:uncharacterized pyridoxal phosphate-containing UPF0001 family protein